MKYFLITFFLLLLTIPAYGGNVIDMDSLPKNLQDEIIKSQKSSVHDTVDTINSWGTIGVQLSQAVGSLCKELNVQINEFIKTPVGVIITLTILWKLILGKMIGHLIGFALILFVLLPIVYKSFKVFHMPIKREIDGKIEYIDSFEFNDNENKMGSLIAHLAIAIILLMVVLINLF